MKIFKYEVQREFGSVSMGRLKDTSCRERGLC